MDTDHTQAGDGDGGASSAAGTLDRSGQARPAPSGGTGPAGAASTEAILAEVRQLLTEVIGEDYVLDLDITMDSTLSGDLGLESLELVVLAERLRERHGERADLIGLFGELDLDQLIDFTVGQVVEHVAAALGPGHDQDRG